jgi:hypothetical protein
VLLLFGIFYSHLVHSVVILVYFSCFGKLQQENLATLPPARRRFCPSKMTALCATFTANENLWMTSSLGARAGGEARKKIIKF